MIRLEVSRANLRKGISGQHFRNTYILNLIKRDSGVRNYKASWVQIKISLKRYYQYAENGKTPYHKAFSFSSNKRFYYDHLTNFASTMMSFIHILIRKERFNVSL